MLVLVAMAMIVFSADLNDFVECGPVDSSCASVMLRLLIAYFSSMWSILCLLQKL